MNSNRSSFDPRVPPIQDDIRTLFDLLANLSGSANNIVFTGPNQLLGSNTTGATITQQLQNEQIPDQEITTTKIIGLDDLLALLNQQIGTLQERLLAIEDQFPITVQYNTLNEADDTWTTVTKVLSNAASAYTFLSETVPKAINYTKRIFDFLKGNGIINGARDYVQLIDEVDNVVSDVAKNVKDIATQTANNTALQTRVTTVESTTQTLQTQTQSLTTQTQTLGTRASALESRASAIENTNIAQTQSIATNTSNIATNTTSIATNTTAIAANDAHDVVQDGLISANTAATTAAATLAGTAQTTATGAASTAAAALAAAAAGAALAALFGLTSSTDSNGNTTYSTTNPAFDPTNINNAISALQLDDNTIKTLGNALVSAGYATLDNNTYTLTPGFLNAVSNITVNTNSINQIIQWFIDAGFITKTTTNGVTTYTEVGIFPGIYTKILRVTNNDNLYSDILDTLGLLRKNYTSGNTSVVSYPKYKYIDLVNNLVTAGVIIQSTDSNGNTIYTANTNLATGALPPQLQQTLVSQGVYTSTTNSDGSITYAPASPVISIVGARSNIDSLRNALFNIGILGANIYQQTTEATALYTETGIKYPSLIRNIMDVMVQLGFLTKNADLTYTYNYLAAKSGRDMFLQQTTFGNILSTAGLATSTSLNAGAAPYFYNATTGLYNIVTTTTANKNNILSLGNVLQTAGLVTINGSTPDTYTYSSANGIYNVITAINNLTTSLNNLNNSTNNANGGNYSSAGLLPPYNPNLCGYWMTDPSFFTAPDGIVANKGLTKWVAAVRQLGIGSAISYDGTTTLYASLVQDGGNSITKNNLTYEPNTASGGFLVPTINLSDRQGPFDQYTIHVLIRPYFSTPSNTTTRGYVFGADSSYGVALYFVNGNFITCSCSPNANGCSVNAVVNPSNPLVPGQTLNATQTYNNVQFQKDKYYLLSLTFGRNTTCNTYYNTSSTTTATTFTLSKIVNINSTSQVTIYVNGQNCGTSAFEGTNTSVLGIGCNGNPNSSYNQSPFAGVINSWAIYNNCQTQTEVNGYKNFLLSKYPTLSLPNIY